MRYLYGNTHKLIINDPIYGFITVSDPLVFDLIAHRYFQRLRRITQMGISYLVYPGANHTRFAHTLGCLHLMQRAIHVLQGKGVKITGEESTALKTAILLHDIGHGPFSHALEKSIIKSAHHEAISLKYMHALNRKFKGRLDLAIAIFENTYPKKFLRQLINSQLDMDRLDYLKRDSFYTGVAEGNINSERLIDLLAVQDDTLVVEQKGIYSVEQFLIGRRLMYWQAYFHKTSLGAERMLIHVLQRSKELFLQGIHFPCTDALGYFLRNENVKFNENTLEQFALLDDSDILSALKSWTLHKDFVLATLSKMIINRHLLKIKFLDSPLPEQDFLKWQLEKAKEINLPARYAAYFIFQGYVKNRAYNDKEHRINILNKDGNTAHLVAASDQKHIAALSKEVVKHYNCYPKNTLKF